MTSSSRKNHVITLFELASRSKIGSGYAGAWGNLGTGASESAYFGKVSHAPAALEVTEQTFFDLASLTKVLSTTTVAMVLHEAGKIDLDAPLESYCVAQTKKNPSLRTITLRQMLSHTSGLPAWRAYYKELQDHFGDNLPFVSLSARKAYFAERVWATPLDAQPNERMVYSDVGFLLASDVFESVTGRKNMAELFQELVLPKLRGGTSLHYRPVLCDAAGAIDPKVSATEICPWRGWLQGQVHDDNTWSLGGIAPHAGLFGTLNDVVQWVEYLFGGKIVSSSTLHSFFKEIRIPTQAGTTVGVRRTLGFDMPSLDGSGTTAFAFSPETVGHLGFTGTSLWVDLLTGDYAVLLTNRVHPSRTDLRIRDLRRSFHTVVRS